jgi:hypothetical protein
VELVMRCVLLSVVAACGFSPTIANTNGIDARDAPDDVTAPPDMVMPGDHCYGTGGLLVQCVGLTEPTNTIHLPGSMAVPFDTGVDGNCTKIVTQAGDGRQLCVIVAGTIFVDGSFPAIGSRPLVLVAADQITVSNVLDVSSTWGGRSGAGNQSSLCTTPSEGGFDSGGGGGGAGGSFSTKGGDGGTGDTNNNHPPAGSPPGGAAGNAQAVPTFLRGGCQGSKGGEGDAANDGTSVGGPPGLGGGAVALVAGTRISVPGAIYASGSGGGTTAGDGSCATNNGGYEQGGGGGGAGGMILLEAPTIDVPGKIAANGGAGGGGGGCRGGQPGGDGSTTSWNTRATGGAGDTANGGDAGGSGSTINMIDQLTGTDASAGAGGGGGGLGVVWKLGTVTGSMISPAPIP